LTSRGSRGWVDPVPDPLLLRKSGSAGDRTRDLCIRSQKLWPLDPKNIEQFKEVSVSEIRPSVLSKMAYWRTVPHTLLELLVGISTHPPTSLRETWVGERRFSAYRRSYLLKYRVRGSWMNVEQLWNDFDSTKRKSSEKNLSHYQYDHQKFLVCWTKWR